MSERTQDAVGRFARLSSALVASPGRPIVFLLEHNEQRDTAAIHVKLDEILLALAAR